MRKNFKLFCGGDMEYIVRWIDSIPFEDGGEGNIKFTLVEDKRLTSCFY